MLRVGARGLRGPIGGGVWGFQRVVHGQEQGDHHHGVLEGGTQNQLAPLNHRSHNFQIAKASMLSSWIGQGFRCGESWSLAAVSDEHGESAEPAGHLDC